MRRAMPPADLRRPLAGAIAQVTQNAQFANTPVPHQLPAESRTRS